MGFTLFAFVQLTIVWLVYRFAFHRGFHLGMSRMRDIVVAELSRLAGGYNVR